MTPGQFRIDVGALTYQGKGGAWERLLGIEAPLRITVGGQVWFEEPSFPVVELAGPVHWWLDRGGDFSFETMEAEETPFLWARQVGDGYQIGAVWQKFECATTFPGFAIRGAFRAFVEHVRSACQSELGINVDDLILTQ